MLQGWKDGWNKAGSGGLSERRHEVSEIPKWVWEADFRSLNQALN